MVERQRAVLYPAVFDVVNLAICVVPEHSVLATFFWPSSGIKTSKD